MTRELNAAVITETGASVTGIAVMVELDFGTGFSRLTNAPVDLSQGGNTYTAVGALGDISAVTEDTGLSSPGLKMTLSGIEPGLLSAAIDEDYYKRTATVYLQFLGGEYETIGAPVEAWSGQMDTMTIIMGDGVATISLVCESRLSMAGQRLQIRSNETQQRRHAGDTFYSFLDQLADIQIDWGGRRVVAAGSVTTDQRGGGRAPDRIDP